MSISFDTRARGFLVTCIHGPPDRCVSVKLNRSVGSRVTLHCHSMLIWFGMLTTALLTVTPFKKALLKFRPIFMRLSNCLQIVHIIGRTLNSSQKTRDIHTTLFQSLASVEDNGPTLKQHWVNAPCLLGSHWHDSVQLCACFRYPGKERLVVDWPGQGIYGLNG